MSRYLLIITLFLFSEARISGQGHVPVFPELDGSELIRAVKTEYKPAVVLTYKDAREVMYRELFNRNDSVTCVYSGHRLYLDPKTGDAVAYLYRNGEANGINCEHTFPQSLGAEFGNARSDMHHLFPVRSAVNEARSNLPYGEIQDQSTERWYYLDRVMSNKPATNIDQYSEYIKTLFEPREDHKGNVARAMFYFASIYRDQADTIWFDSQLPTLCQWHGLDPVDEAEWLRNEQIAELQSDKLNPFILDCTLAYRCFCPNVPPCEPETPVFRPEIERCRVTPLNQSGTNWSLECDQPLDVLAQLVDVQGRVLKEQELTSQIGNPTPMEFQETLFPGWYVIRLVERESGRFLYARPFIVADSH